MHFDYDHIPWDCKKNYKSYSYPSRYKVTFTKGQMTISLHVYAEDASKATFTATQSVCKELSVSAVNLKHVSTIIEP